ncbi:ATPase [Prauserella marina]|uniref:Clp amino terminal domain-containing protein, pathogenicity island component n=1 Tax=Prauserella marina TaxID=530584 RepID=A0A222VJ02_9PSEU|nr:Clp protease N-terminal domain-containing protein [Prauserella marina]ASR33909.1 ATPase [Prauserella marina]PWV82507.1 ClpA/ClpB-like protein [Prauserella marina]SDC70812.1 Clp amino terminal domain-containing protein, pathogenicity island component [Prauserella marina]
MFERFTGDARGLVKEAVREAAELGSPEIDSLHLLAALARFPGGGAATLLSEFDVALDDVVASVAVIRRRGDLSEADAEALGNLGIDVDQVVERVEREHGRDALARRKPKKPGHIPFAAGSKRLLERCLEEVVMLRSKEIGGEHILLAMAAVPGPAADVLAEFDVTAERIRAALRRAA